MTDTKVERKQTLREWRDEFGMTQKGVANAAGIGQGQYWKLEKGCAKLSKYYRDKLAAAFNLQAWQIIPCEPNLDFDPDQFPDDGLRHDAPVQSLKWWRERRGITQAELAAFSHLGYNTVREIEQGTCGNVRAPTRRRLGRSLRVAVDNIAFPGDGKPISSEKPREDLLREDLRAARYALRKAHDFIIDDAAITFRYQEQRDALLPDIQRELRGTWPANLRTASS